MARATKEDRAIDAIYRKYCTGRQIEVMCIPTLFNMARAMIRGGKDEATIGQAMIDFVEGIEV